MSSPRRLIFRSFQSPGDIVMLTGAVRDLHLANPGQFETDVRTSADAIWQHNPRITRLTEGDPTVQSLEMHYPLIHECNQRPYHFIHGYVQYLEQQLGVKIPITRFSGDIHLSEEEKTSPPLSKGGPGGSRDLQTDSKGSTDTPDVPDHFWIVMAGGKNDFTAKWWNPASYQAVVDHFRGKIQFVQCGEAGHWHPPLEGVINLVGKTDTRSFIRLVYHADGVLCPVTFAMHLAAAVETKPGSPRHRPCVVVAGGREPPHWEAYPHHQFISTVGALPCCADGGCWKSRCQLVGDGDPKDHHDVCVSPVQVTPQLRIPQCLEMITPAHVIERIEFYYRGGALNFGSNGQTSNDEIRMSKEIRNPKSQFRNDNEIPNPNSEILPMNVLITIRHGLGDGAQVTIVLQHLQKYRPDWIVHVAALVGKHSAYHGLCRQVFVLDRESPPCCDYSQRFNLDWHECHTAYPDSPSTKAERCLREEFGIIPDPELCHYSIQRGEKALALARRYLEDICARADVGPPASPPLSKGGPGGSGERQFGTQLAAAHVTERKSEIPASRRTGPNSQIRFPVVLIHYEGNTSADMKNIPTEIVRRLCEDIIEEGYVPVILDWDYRTPLADGVRIHCPDQRAELWHGTGTGDAESLAALTELSSLTIGVDSGPLHVAGATSTPTLGVWTRHHPLHYFSHADNVTHLVPRDHAALIRGNRATGEAYFNGHYRYQVYDDLEMGLRSAVRSRLQTLGLPPFARGGEGGSRDMPTDSKATIGATDVPGSLFFTRNFWIRADTAEQDLVIVTDIAEQDSYGIDEMPMPRPVIVDVGAHIGCFSKRLHQRNPLARIFAVECCPENIPALEKNVSEFATVVHGAMTYESDVALLNAVYVNCRSTGGSALISRTELEKRVAAATGSPALPLGEGRGEGEGRIRLGEYWADLRPLRTLTIEELMQEHDFDFIDVLKLDCEGSEFSILGKTPSLDRIGLAVGEYHGKERFSQLVADRFHGWEFRILRDGDTGTFWLVNPSVSVRKSIVLTGIGAISVGRGASLPPVVRVRQEGAQHVTTDSRSTHTRSVVITPQPVTPSFGDANGDPSFHACLTRLRAAAHANDRIIVEDFGLIPAVRQACDTFTSEHPEFERRHGDNGQSGCLVFERSGVR